MSRGRHIAAVLGAVIAPVAATIAACATDGPTSPEAGGRLALAVAPDPQQVGPGAPQPPLPNATDSLNRVSPAQLASKASDWHTRPDDQESGNTKPLSVSCGFRGQYTVSRTVGPAGGVLTLGRSSLTIPEGALTGNVQISATVTLGSSVTVDFQPHGLRFAKAVTMVADFTGCTFPSSSPGLNVYYLNDAGAIAQSMPSARLSGTAVQALTDHFSGYAVSWGRASDSGM